MEATFRATCRTQVTKLCNAITEYLKTFETIAFSECSDPSSVETQLTIYVQRLKNVHTNLRKADEAMRPFIKTEDLAKECETVLEYDDKAITIIAQLEHVLRSHFKQNQNDNEASVGERNVTSVPEDHNFIGVKLKPFELKKFDGNIENWLPFWELFKRAVHENKQFSAAAKFNFLSESLIGRAGATIAGFTPTEKCYKEAIDLLLEEYGHTDRIVEKFVQKLMNLSVVHSNKDIKGLRELYNEVISTTRTLSAFQISSTQYDIMVKSILLKCIPATMRVEFHRSVARNNTSSILNSSVDSAIANLQGNGQESEQLNSLLSFIRGELEAMEMSQLPESGKRYSDRRDTKPKTATTSALYVSNDFAQYCIFCKRNSHSTAMCRSRISIENKKTILRREGRCFRCTNKNHNSKFCKTSNIKCGECGGRHVTSMCERENKRSDIQQNKVKERNYTKQNNENKSSNWSASTQRESAVTIAATTALNVGEVGKDKIFLQTARAIISNVDCDNHLVSRIIMDNGSQRTFITEKVKTQLKLKSSGVVKINIVGFGNKKNKNMSDYDEVQIALKGQYHNNIIIIKAIVVPSICDNFLPCPEHINNMSSHIKFELADREINNEKTLSGINLLIGQDNYWKFNTNNCEKISDNLMAINTFFGWTIQGHQKSEWGKQIDCQYVLNVTESGKEIENFDVTKFWDLESIGIKPSVAYDNKLYKKTIREIKFVNERYVVSLPWKNIDEYLNNNRAVAKKRLYYLTNKLLKNNEKMTEYDNEIRSLIRSGIAENADKDLNYKSIYYMPHKPVYRDDKSTTKLRIVFDASSSENGCSSLNDHLSPVDNLVANLFTLLLRFRSNKIAMIADIEKAFLQMAISENDRDSHRFLWYKSKPEINKQLPEIVEFRMTRVTFGSTSSPFLLTATINHHIDKYTKRFGSICEKLKSSFYVDDLILSVNSREEANNIYYTAKEIMTAAHFNLRKWTTNDQHVEEIFGEHIESNEHKVLGIIWNKTFDTVGIDITKNLSYLQSLKATKRNVLKSMAKIYDPMGFLGPFTVRVKILLQTIWEEHYEWDQLLVGNVADSFQKWQGELETLKEFSFPRCLSPYKESTNELHIFADASPKAFGVVAYVRAISKAGEMTTNFICSKNRISPMKQANKEITLPQLELTAALVAARLKQFLITALDFKVHSTTLWTDSSITLSWINGQGKQCKPYVKTKVMEINNLTNINDWRHCDGKSNPADLLTRGIKAKELVTSERWKIGPSWLLETKSSWPVKINIETATSLFASDISTTKVELSESVIDIKRFSNINRLLRTTAYVFRVVQRAKSPLGITKQEIITAREIQQAEKYWITTTQMQYYSGEIAALQKNLNKLPADSKISSLNPSLIDGILRANCRLPDDEFCSDERNPIILPKHAHFSRLIVLDAHRKSLHGGISTVLAHIRTKYWIIQARQLIKSILQRCVVCIRLHGKSAMEPWTVLPTERVVTSRPFETTGVDFAGPLFVTSETDDVQKKVYIMLFTCATIRAVHLELVGDMSTKSCIDAIRRFIARRGIPSKIISDNAKTFKRADLELRKLEQLLKSNDVQNMAAHQTITWQFIPERAAWWGGFWERLVKSVKICLKAAIGKAKLSTDDLTTLLAEVESVVNARPITYVTSDHNDLEPLTPSHFLNNCKCILSSLGIQIDGSALA